MALAHGRSRGPRVPGRRPGPDGLCRPTAMAGCLDGDPRGQDGPPRAGAHVGMHLADQRGGAAHRSRSAALGPVAGRLPAHRQPPASPGPERNGAVTQGRRPRAKIAASAPAADPPGPSRATGPSPAAARTQLMCSSRRRPANVRSSPAGKNTRAHHRQPAHRRAARQQPAEHPGQGAARVRPARAHHLHLPLCRRRRTPAAVRRQLNKGKRDTVRHRCRRVAGMADPDRPHPPGDAPPDPR
jgi:hypothetical protein